MPDDSTPPFIPPISCAPPFPNRAKLKAISADPPGSSTAN